MKGRVLVTGHQGFIGSLLVPMLLSAGYEVVGLDTCFFGEDCEFFKPELDGIRTLIKDIRLITPADLEGIDHLCHLAALSNDPLGELDPQVTLAINYEASVNLAKSAKKAGVKRFIFASSCSLYGISDQQRAMTEEDVLEPMTAYARSKALTEQAILPLADNDFVVTSLRNATAYGISAKLRLDLVVNNLAAWAVTSGTIKILSDGTPWRPVVHAQDIARAFLAVIEAPAGSINGQAFNVGLDTENYQIKDIAAMVEQAVPSCRVIITGEHGMDTRTYKVDFSKIRRQVPGFEPRWRLKEAMGDILESYRKNKMDDVKFQSRCFVRLRQLRFLIGQGDVDSKLFWKTGDHGKS